MGSGGPIDELSFAVSQSLFPSSKGSSRSVVGPRSLQHGLPMSVPRRGVPVTPLTTQHARRLLAKRVFDVVVSALALMLLLLPIGLVTLLVKVTSRGPAFFRQTREGYRGVPFFILKFRTMAVEHCDDGGQLQAAMHDPRVTWIGRFLRRTSLDEVPQLINVLRGEMSLVGPRPHVPNMRAAGMRYRDLVSYYDRRLEMVPGLTGWAQANGLRGPTDRADHSRARIDHDIAYMQNFSFWLDLRIVLLTIRREFLGGSGH